MELTVLILVLGIAALWYLHRIAKLPESGDLLVLAMVVLSLTVMPRTLFGFGEFDSAHAGVTASAPLIGVYHVALAIAALHFTLSRRFKIPWSHVAFLLGTALMISMVWGDTSEQWAGFLHFTTAVVSWGVGYGAARSLDFHSTSSTMWAALIAIVVLFQLGIAAFQLLGTDFGTIVTGIDRDVMGRAIGTLGNPANLSKIAFYLLILLVPLSASTVRATRRWAVIGIVASVLVTGMTVSRANMVAVAAMLLVWGLLVPGRLKLRYRLALFAGLAVGFWVFSEAFAGRAATDALDPRGRLLAAALANLPEYFWGGLGVNSYVSTIGAFDAATASGFPVHNAFLLATIEMGVVLALLFFLPLVFLGFRALGAVRRGKRGNVFLWAYVAAVPGLIAIMMTGWAALAGFMLPTLFFVLGVLERQGTASKHDAQFGMPAQTQTDDLTATRSATRQQSQEHP